jgi:hypothetical protein
MIMRSKINKLLHFVLVVLLLQACGGGGGGDDGSPNNSNDNTDLTSTAQNYSGETGQATLTSENAEDLSTAAASGAKQAINSDSVPVVPARSDSPVSRDEILEAHAGLVRRILNGDYSNNAARGATAAREENLTSTLCDSGSIIATYPDSGAGNWSIAYNQCTRTVSYGGHTYSTSYNGTVEGTHTQAGNGFRYEYQYENFTVAIQSPTGNHSWTFNMSMTCTANEGGTNFSCEYYSDYQGLDNRIYRVSNVDVSGNESTGYNVSVRVYDPDHGYVTVTTEVPVTYGCTNGYPDAGRVHVEGANGTVVTVEFTSCSAYVVVLDGVANTYNWP